MTDFKKLPPVPGGSSLGLYMKFFLVRAMLVVFVLFFFLQGTRNGAGTHQVCLMTVKSKFSMTIMFFDVPMLS